MPKKTSLPFVNLHGQPLPGVKARAGPGDGAPAAAPPRANPPPSDPADAQAVFDALVLSGFARGKTPVLTLLTALGWKRADGRAFDAAHVGAALHALQADGRVKLNDGNAWQPAPQAEAQRLPAVLARPDAAQWWLPVAWAAGSGYGPRDQPPAYLELRSPGEARAMLRLLLLSGAPPRELDSRLSHWRSLFDPQAVLAAMGDLVGAGVEGRAQREAWWGLLAAASRHLGLAAAPVLAAWVSRHVDAERAQVPPTILLPETEARLHRGDEAGMHALLADERLAADRPLFAAAWLARQGRWAEAAAAFPGALKTLAADQGRRRGLAPWSLLQWYALALIAQPDPKAWALARRLCVAESGSRRPAPREPLGRWANVIDARLGDARLEPGGLDAPPAAAYAAASPALLADLPILAAWLGHRAQGWTASRLNALAQGLLAGGLPWKAELLRQACERLQWPAPTVPEGAWPVRFFGEAQAAWRDALAAIVALGGEGRAVVAAEPAATLQWRLHLDREGRVANLEAFEPSASGRGRPKPLGLLALKRRTRLDPRDAAVARTLRSAPYRASELSFDLVQAAQALVGHPALELAQAPGVAVDLHESLPALSVHRSTGADGQAHFVFELEDALLANSEPALDHHAPDEWSAHDAERERRNTLRIVQDAPGRARLIRISAAQRRVAELVAQRWQVPAGAQAELDAALRVLSGHFVVHSDAEAGEPVQSDSRLVAQLEPKADALQLRVLVRPFGEFGPLLVPGHGRARLLTLHGGVSLATERNLDAERKHWAALVAQLPAGAAEDPLPDDATWLLDDAELALAVVDRLGALAAVAGSPLRALEWPRGRTLRVHAAQPGAMQLAVNSGRDWFGVDGELKIDESRVLSLQRLLALLRESRGSRFVALGRGEYLALTEQLRQRLADLDALAAPPAAGDAATEPLRVAAAAAGWLAEAAPELGLTGDARWRQRALRLQDAAALDPREPPGLRAELRPYQLQGYAWMVRLAHAGFGAILADDMGLGKTVQTLALLLNRAALGPALVVAPTSVCANWVAEAARFAPGLEVIDHAGSTRRLAVPGADQLVVVSYALLLRDAEQFQAVEWATLVLDEAQALKNAATQRVKAVAALGADFRLALSGTPVENRLSDLWSLMALINPGLLGTATRFAERFGTPIERNGDPAARARLRRLVGPFLLRRTKAEVLADLPPRTEIVQRVEPTPEERAFLDAARREALARIAAIDPADGRRAFNVLGELTRLRRAACDPRLTAPELGLVGAKVQAFERLARELVEGRHQALVFSQFTDFLKLLAERLDAAGLRYQMLDGSTPAAQRAERVAAFQRGDGDLFLISLKAGGFGLNLTAADYVVIADPWWNPAAEDQATGRAHRIGQQRPVTVYRLVTAGSVEERIVALHADKRQLAEGVLAGQDGGRPPAADELLALLRDDARALERAPPRVEPLASGR